MTALGRQHNVKQKYIQDITRMGVEEMEQSCIQNQKVCLLVASTFLYRLVQSASGGKYSTHFCLGLESSWTIGMSCWDYKMRRELFGFKQNGFTDIIINSKNLPESSMEDHNIPKRKYSRISMKKRQKLVEMIQHLNYTIEKASKKTGIKASTARRIFNKYKETGLFPMKQFKKNKKGSPIQRETAPNSADLSQNEPIKNEQSPAPNIAQSHPYPPPNALIQSYPGFFNYVWVSVDGAIFPYIFA